MTGRTATLLARCAALAALAMAVAACGSGSGESEPSPDPTVQPPATTEPPPTPPPGFPRRVATGSLRDGSRWSLTETGLDQVCIRISRTDVDIVDCLDITSTWPVWVRPLGGSGEPGVLVLAGLPCGVSRVELRRNGEALDGGETTVSDDVNYVVLEGPEGLDGVELVALGRDSSELFRIDRLRNAPGERVPTIGC